MDSTTEIVRALGRVEGQMKSLNDSVTSLATATENRSSALEVRVTSIEQRVSRAYGIAGGIGIAGGAFGYMLRYMVIR